MPTGRDGAGGFGGRRGRAGVACGGAFLPCVATAGEAKDEPENASIHPRQRSPAWRALPRSRPSAVRTEVHGREPETVSSSRGFEARGVLATLLPGSQVGVVLAPVNCDVVAVPRPRSKRSSVSHASRPVAAGVSRAAPTATVLASQLGDVPRRRFRRGTSYPRAIAWFGVSSFWGHLWHLAASAIATEDIDARDWMEPGQAEDFTAEAARALGGDDTAETLAEALGDDVWIDFVADTGDDADVSAAVADLLSREYEIAAGDADDPNEGRLRLPRGQVLLFGGDTAYPVATQLEIHNRVCVPWNRVLRGRQDGRPRLLLGIPGNHDWYDGCDGFARMFRKRRGQLDRRSMLPPELEVERTGQIAHLLDWVEAFRVGAFVGKRATLPLFGYEPLQSASYFALALAPGLDLWAVDRQLRRVDWAQKNFFGARRAARPDQGLFVVTADPAFAHLDPYPFGLATLEDVGLELERDGLLMMSGDTHHYCRQELGDTVHVTAGGGGAFLQPARIARRGYAPPAREFPGPRASLALALQIPWYLALGRAGFLVHIITAALYAPLLLVAHEPASFAVGAAVVGVLAAASAGLLAGWRKRSRLSRAGITLMAVGLGGGYALLPFGALAAARALAGGALGQSYVLFFAYAACIVPAAFAFGLYLMLVTVLGLEQHHAFGALRHPGYKHFVRLRVRRDGSAIDGFAIGKVDTADPAEPAVLVDRFRWRNRCDRGPGGPH